MNTRQRTSVAVVKNDITTHTNHLTVLEDILQTEVQDFFNLCKSRKISVNKSAGKSKMPLTLHWPKDLTKNKKLTIDLSISEAASQVFLAISKEKINLLNWQLEVPNLTKQEKAKIMDEIFNLENKQITLIEELEKAKGELKQEDFSNLGNKFNSSSL